MKKAILLVRVSTEQQSLDDQSRELRQLALADGYREENITAIEDKESAIKLDEEERHGLNQMKELIETDPDYNCVYVWEISRLSRRPKVLFSIKEYLLERNVQLKIKEPPITLMLPSGSPDPGAELVFSLYATMSEQEMREKKARFARAKKALAAAGKYCGGPRKFGYMFDKDNNYIICEEEAEIIRLIYDLYITTDVGYSGIWKELKARGLTKMNGDDIKNRFVLNILKDTAYTGQSVNRGIVRNYPVIISKETFDMAQRVKAGKNVNVCKTPRWWFAHKIVKCPVCGHYYTALSGSTPTAPNVYQCFYHTARNKDHDRCTNNVSISIEWMDRLLLAIAEDEHVNFLAGSRKKALEKNMASINVLERKIEIAEKKTAKIEQSLERCTKSFILGYISEEECNRLRSELQEQKKEMAQETEHMKRKIVYIGQMIEQLEQRAEMTHNDKQRLRIKLWGASHKEKYDIIHQHIREAIVSRAVIDHPNGKTYNCRRIDVEYMIGKREVYYFLHTVGRRKYMIRILKKVGDSLKECPWAIKLF